jgi:hypothetical protein
MLHGGTSKTPATWIESVTGCRSGGDGGGAIMVVRLLNGNDLAVRAQHLRDLRQDPA